MKRIKKMNNKDEMYCERTMKRLKEMDYEGKNIFKKY